MATDRPLAVAQNAPPRVIIYGNDGPFMPPGDPELGQWGYFPTHIDVRQGEQITFDTPAGNRRPHTVTSITCGGTNFARTLDSGTRFNSSPDQQSLLMSGGSWTLDTGTLDPGQYVYYCTLHPWMVGTFTVMPAEYE